MTNIKTIPLIIIICLIILLVFSASVVLSSAVSPNDTDYGGNITRLKFIENLAEASGDDIQKAAENYPYKNKQIFSDVPENDSVTWAYMKWIINGDDNSLFRPDAAISQQEAAVILARYIDYRFTALPPVCGTGMADVSSAAAWASEYAGKSSAYRIIPEGYNFSAAAPLSSEDAAAWINNAVTLNASAIGVPEKPVFSDDLIAKLNPKGNWTVSPYSVRMCLAMLANGAKGTTQQEMLDALQIDNIDEFNSDVKKLLETYDGYQRIMSLNTANSMWLNQSQLGSSEFLKSFTDKLTANYRAESNKVTNADSVEKVNAWVNEKTNEKIPTILDESHRDFATALVNAVYFKAAWQDEFYEGATKEDEFNNADGTVSKTDFMNKSSNGAYYSTPGIEAIKLDYKNYAVDEDGSNFERFKNADFSMYFIKSDDDKLNVQHFLDNADFTLCNLNISLPKFKIEYSADLNDALKALGINTGYNPELADFSAMVDTSKIQKNIFIDSVIHKTYIAIDEKGTEAAAVTAAMNGATSAAPPDRPELVRDFTADKPFFFAIRDNVNKEILFAGRYEAA